MSAITHALRPERARAMLALRTREVLQSDVSASVPPHSQAGVHRRQKARFVLEGVFGSGKSGMLRARRSSKRRERQDALPVLHASWYIGCTYMTGCTKCATEWCYVCGLSVADWDKAPPRLGNDGNDIYLNNRDWESNEKRCPMYLTQILDVDLHWLGEKT